MIWTPERIWFFIILTIAWNTGAFLTASSKVARVIDFSVIIKHLLINSILFILVGWTVFWILVNMSIEYFFIIMDSNIILNFRINIFNLWSPQKDTKIRFSNVVLTCSKIHYLLCFFLDIFLLANHKCKNYDEQSPHFPHSSFIMFNDSYFLENFRIKGFVYLEVRILFYFQFESFKSVLILHIIEQVYISIMFTFAVDLWVKKNKTFWQSNLCKSSVMSPVLSTKHFDIL